MFRILLQTVTSPWRTPGSSQYKALPVGQHFRKLIDASKAYYLRGTEIGFCCEPYWLAFASREEAKKFAKGFKGEVLNFEDALDKAQQDHPHHHQ